MHFADPLHGMADRNVTGRPPKTTIAMKITRRIGDYSPSPSGRGEGEGERVGIDATCDPHPALSQRERVLLPPTKATPAQMSSTPTHRVGDMNSPSRK